MSRIYNKSGHSGNASQRMWKYYQMELFCDIVLIAGTNEIRIPSHRLVLCAASDYFETMLTSSFDESTAREVKLSSLDGEIVKEIVRYCYTGRVEIIEDNVEKLLETADLLHLGFVVSACGDFLAERLHPTNCLGIALLAELHHCDLLLKQAKDYSYKHFLELYTTEEFLNLNATQLGQLLASDQLNVQVEEDVFRSLMAWLEHRRYEREEHKDELLKLVRLPLFQPYFLTEYVKIECTPSVRLQLYHDVTKWHSFPQCKELNTNKSRKPRRFNPILMATYVQNNKLNILYHCPLRLNWMKWVDDVNIKYSYNIAVIEDNLFIVGGINKNDFVLNNVICLNLSTMTLKDVSPMNDCRYNAATAVLKGSLYVVGGQNLIESMKSTVSSVEKWDSKTNKWSIISSMPRTRFAFGSAVFNEKLYLFGGFDADLKLLSSAEYYDPEKNVWTSIASMHGARCLSEVPVVNGLLYAVGSNSAKEKLFSIEYYDPKTDKWTPICINKICNPQCIALYGKLHFIYHEEVEEYNPLTNEWKVNTSINGLDNFDYYFWYSGELLASKFEEFDYFSTSDDE